MLRRIQLMWVVGVLALSMGGSVTAADWGDLTMKFLLDGAAPAAKPLTVNKDVEVCGKFGLVDEQLTVNPANKGVANVVVFLYVGRGEKQPPVHESYKASEKGMVAFDNDKCRFEPRVVGLRTSQTLLVGNKDSIGHNTNVTTLRNPPQNILIPANGSLKMNFSAEESLPATVACNIHPWMKGYVVIKEHPYVGVSDKDGNVTIKNVPAGKWTFQVWQEAAGYVTEATVGGKKVTWARGRMETTIKAGANDMGEVKLTPSIFKLN